MTNAIKIYLYILMLTLLPAAKSLAMFKEEQCESKSKVALPIFMLFKHWAQDLGVPNDVVYEISKIMRTLFSIEEALQSGDYVFEREIRGDFRKTVDFSPNSSFVIANNMVIHAQDGSIKHRFPSYKHFFSPDGKLIAIADEAHKKLSILNSEDNTLLKTFQSDSYIAKCAFSHDNSFVIIVGNKHFLIGKMEIESLDLIDNVDYFYSLAISPDDTLIAFSTEEDIQLWDIATLAIKSVLFDGDYFGDCALVFSPDGKELSAKKRNSITTWDIEKNEKKRSINLGSLGEGQQYKHAWAFSSEGRLMARSCWPGYDRNLPTIIEIFNDLSGKKLRTFKEIDLRIVGMALSPDGHRLTLIINLQSLQIWALRPLVQKKTMKQGAQA